MSEAYSHYLQRQKRSRKPGINEIVKFIIEHLNYNKKEFNIKS